MKSRQRHVLALIASIAFFFAACAPSRATAADLLATLPAQVAGQNLDFVQIVDEQFLSGHPIDDVLARLGKRRDAASVVFRDDQVGSGGVGAATVDGVDGNDLLRAVLDTWSAAAVTSKSQHVVDSRPVWLLVERAGQQTYVYAQGRVVYFASSESPDRALVLVKALP